MAMNKRIRRKRSLSGGNRSRTFINSKNCIYEFPGSDVKFEFNNEDIQEMPPQALPLASNFNEFKSTGSVVLDFFVSNVRLWILDFLSSDPIEKWDFDDFSKLLFNLEVSPTLENFVLDLESNNAEEMLAHFSFAFSDLIESQKECERSRINELRSEFNSVVQNGAAELSDVEIRFLSGVVAASGYLEGFVDIENIRFIESLDLICFQKHHFLKVKPGEIEKSISPAGNLFSSFFIDIDESSSEKSWRKMNVMLGSPILEKLPNSVTTGPLRKIARGYEIKSENLPKLDEVILDSDVKQKLVNLLEFFKHQDALGEKAALRILLRGVPGSGKSMLSQAIADYFGVGAICLNLSSLRSRNVFYLLATFIERAKKNKMVLVLEECEQLLSVNPFTGASDDTAKLMFEDHEGIVIFTTNEKGSSSWFAPTEAVERRMDFIVDFEMPGPEHRERILTQEIKKWTIQGWQSDITPEDIKKLSKTVNLSGGFLPQALKQAASCGISEKRLSLENLASSIGYVSEKSNAAGHGNQAGTSEIKMDQVILNSEDRKTVDRIIKYSKDVISKKDRNPILPQGATVLFSGAPGTGKTMTAQAIASEMEMKIRMTTASDFLSMYVGGTEKNIKNIFKAAERKKEVLFIDEVEGLLHSRGISQRSWETTQVNEFLKAIESFKGVLICATNHTEMMDHAFARRFLFHLRFTLPNVSERMVLWRQYLAGLRVEDHLIERIAQRFELSGGEIRNAAIRAQVAEESEWIGLERLCQEVESSRTGEVIKRIGIS